jgi:hypothetical protein
LRLVWHEKHERDRRISPGSAAIDWAVTVTGDFDGDGFADILWRNTNSGQVVIWLLNGTKSDRCRLGRFGYDGLRIAGAGDFATVKATSSGVTPPPAN